MDMFSNRRRNSFFFTELLVAGVLSASLASVPAIAAKPIPKTAVVTITTVASGLHNPRGLKFGPDGHLYVGAASALEPASDRW
jgi:glucose/arabinose dehydrogenase